jgi:hypothetical protein
MLINPSSHALERYGHTPHLLEWKASELKSSVITENTQTLDVKTEHPQTTTYIIQKHHVHFASSNA